MTLTNRSAGGCCEQWQTSLTHTWRGRKMCALIRPRAIIILARVGRLVPPTTSLAPPRHRKAPLTLVWRPLCQGRLGRRPFGRLGVGDSRPCCLFTSFGTVVGSDRFFRPLLLGRRRARSPSSVSRKVPSPRFGVCPHVRSSIMEPNYHQSQYGGRARCG